MSLELTSNDLQINFKMRELSGNKVYEFEDLRLDADHLLLFRGQEQLGLTPKVVETLLALIERHGEILNKDELMAIVWPDSIVEESNLSQNLYLLRKTLGHTSDGKPFIETLRRRGYRFSAEVRVTQNHFKTAETERPVKIERSDNIYSVVDWQRAGDLDADVATRREISEPAARGPKWKVAMLWGGVIAVLILGGLLAASIYTGKMFSSSRHQPSLAAPGELTFTHLTNGIDVNAATISPDGSYFVYHETEGDTQRLWLQQTGQSTRVELIPASTRRYASKTFAPDGRSIFFIATDKDAETASIYRIPVLGGVPAKIADDAGAIIAVAPDGMHIAFSRNRKDNSFSTIIIAGTDGTGERPLLTSPTGRLIGGGLSWSPDGNSIAYGQFDLTRPAVDGLCTIAAADPQSGATRELSSERWDGCGRMEWTRDGKGLLFIGSRKGETGTSQRDQLYYLSTETGGARRLTTEGVRHDVSSLGVTQDGSVLVLPFNRSSQLWAMDAGGNSATAREITNGLADGRAGIAPLADGRIGYIAKVGDNFGVWIADADGANARQITPESLDVEELRASPDGRFFYFATLDARPRLLRCAVDGSGLTQVMNDETFDVDTSLSPNGEWIAYNSVATVDGAPRHTLRLASMDGTSNVELTGLYAETPHFSPDGRYVSFVGDAGLTVITVPDGRLVARFKPEPVPILNVGARWTPDGKGLTYIVRQKGYGNIWVQPLDGSAPHTLTDFTSAEIYNFAFTPDGKRLIVARGYPIRDAILIKTTD
jgi:Tol biopolymer transport system component/DNA-binding winged helix-turn-helix (wHTH) protein